MSLPSTNPDQAWSMIKSHQKRIKVNLLNPNPYIPDQYIRVVVIADTHNRHSKITIPHGDLLLHCGDFTFYGDKKKDLQAFDSFLGTLPHQKKILIAGNHDWALFSTNRTNWFHFKNCEYLQDSSTTAFGYKIYGTPWVPHFHHGAFMLDRGEQLSEKWQLIPSDTDILMTHGPPLGYGDKTAFNGHAGDVDLLLNIQKRIRPTLHLFGHIHEAYGSWSDGSTTFINASICDIHYRPRNAPVVVDLPIRSVCSMAGHVESL